MNAVAMEDTFIYCWSKQLFTSLLQNPQISLKIVQYLAQKAGNYTEYMSHFVLKDVRGRIISLLDRLAEEYGNPSPLGLTISINLTHQDIGNLINASRVMVTNVLNELRKENLVHIDRQRITLLDHSLPCD
jgi:CRP/FNR family transcriptional regulator